MNFGAGTRQPHTAVVAVMPSLKELFRNCWNRKCFFVTGSTYCIGSVSTTPSTLCDLLPSRREKSACHPYRKRQRAASHLYVLRNMLKHLLRHDSNSGENIVIQVQRVETRVCVVVTSIVILSFCDDCTHPREEVRRSDCDFVILWIFLDLRDFKICSVF